MALVEFLWLFPDQNWCIKNYGQIEVRGLCLIWMMHLNMSAYAPYSQALGSSSYEIADSVENSTTVSSKI